MKYAVFLRITHVYVTESAITVAILNYFPKIFRRDAGSPVEESINFEGIYLRKITGGKQIYPKSIFHVYFGKCCFFGRKNFETTFRKSFLMKRVMFIFIVKRTIPLKNSCVLKMRFPLFSRKIVPFPKKLFKSTPHLWRKKIIIMFVFGRPCSSQKSSCHQTNFFRNFCGIQIWHTKCTQIRICNSI